MTAELRARVWPPSGPGLRKAGLGAVVAVQAVSAFYFVYNIFGSLLGIPTVPIPWAAYELVEILATLGLSIGSAVTIHALRTANRQRREAETRLAQVARAFQDLLAERFQGWGLTTAERDVAWFVIKGFSTQEIAALRKTSEGTVKAQTAAIYRKAGVSGRAQLVSLFIEDLMDDRLSEVATGLPRPAAG